MCEINIPHLNSSDLSEHWGVPSHRLINGIQSWLWHSNWSSLHCAEIVKKTTMVTTLYWNSQQNNHHYILLHLCCEFKSCSGEVHVLDTTLYDKVCQWLAACQWFTPATQVSSTNDHHDITEILLTIILTISEECSDDYFVDCFNTM
jgi:hypothetical protein